MESRPLGVGCPGAGGGSPQARGVHRRDFSWGAVPGGPRGCAQRAGGCQQGEVEGIERKGKREKESKKKGQKKKKKGEKKRVITENAPLYHHMSCKLVGKVNDNKK